LYFQPMGTFNFIRLSGPRAFFDGKHPFSQKPKLVELVGGVCYAVRRRSRKCGRTEFIFSSIGQIIIESDKRWPAR